MRPTLSFCFFSLAMILVPGCPASMTAVADGGGTDAPPAIDGGPPDAPAIEAGVDAAMPPIDAPGVDGCVPDCAGRVCGDDGCGGSCGDCLTGATCTAAGACDCPMATCDTDVCGVSSCGRSCGACAAGEGCFMGACMSAATCPGTPCTDRAGRSICEGQAGLGRCTTDAALDAVCVCSGSGGELACDACIAAAVPPAIGTACTDASECPAGVPCGFTGLCGEPCDPTAACTSGVCFIPGDVSGACLEECACDIADTCPAGTRCIDVPGGTTSACVDVSRATGATCSLGG